MEAEKLVFYNCSQRQEVEEFCEAFPNVGIAIFAAAFIIKAVDLSYLPRFMVSS